MKTTGFLLIFILIGTVGTSTINVSYSQNMPGNNMMNQGMMNNQTMMDTNMMKTKSLNGSIDIGSTFVEALKSKVNVDIVKAIEIAQNTIGQNSMVISANIEPKGGFLVYSTIVMGENEKLHKVIIDPGTGEVLITKNIGKAIGPQQGMMMGPQQGMMMGR
ncbi:MAG: PepSY domain-containing protein [Nitrososphaeraceae archaeon]